MEKSKQGTSTDKRVFININDLDWNDENAVEEYVEWIIEALKKEWAAGEVSDEDEIL